MTVLEIGICAAMFLTALVLAARSPDGCRECTECQRGSACEKAKRDREAARRTK